MSQGYGNKFKRYNNNNSKPSKPCTNPIFEQWLIEWREEAVQKNSKMQFVYSKALISLRKYPLVLRSGKECKLLEFFGDTLCKMIDNRMSKEPELFQNDQSMMQGSSSSSSAPLAEIIDLADSPPPATKSKSKSKGAGSKKKRSNENDNSRSNSQASDDEQPGPSKRKQPTKKSRSYIPEFRSGGYAILITLFKKETCPDYRGMLKSELMSAAQKYCDASFTRPEQPNSHYTAWNSMSTLIKKELVIKQGSPVKYMLTVEGRELAGKLLQAERKKNGEGNNDFGDGLNSHDSQEDDDAEVEVTFISSNVTLLPGEFDIILCVDTGETSAKCKKEEVIDELRKNGVVLEVQRLNVGDFVWIARESPKGNLANRRLTIPKGNDLVLPFVVERKRADDLAHSIKDKRYSEQKQRLSQCGLKPIYLIESHGRGDWGLAEGALTQAIANTQIVNEFLIHETNSIKHTCAYLTHMTRHLTKMYQNKRLMSCTREEWPTMKLSLSPIYLLKFTEFNEFAVKTKNWTVTEMFAKHIMRLRGLSGERAQAIITEYPTLQHLLRAYRQCGSEKERENLLAPIYYGTSARTIGPALSKSIYKLYSLPTLL